MCLNLCNKWVGNKCVSKVPHRIRMIRERVIGDATLSLGGHWTILALKEKLSYIILKVL